MMNLSLMVKDRSYRKLYLLWKKGLDRREWVSPFWVLFHLAHRFIGVGLPISVVVQKPVSSRNVLIVSRKFLTKPRVILPSRQDDTHNASSHTKKEVDKSENHFLTLRRLGNARSECIHTWCLSRVWLPPGERYRSSPQPQPLTTRSS